MRMPPIISPITRAWPTLSASQPQLTVINRTMAIWVSSRVMSFSLSLYSVLWSCPPPVGTVNYSRLDGCPHLKLLSFCRFSLLLVFAATVVSAHGATRADLLRGTYGPYRANNDLLFYHLDIR